MFERGRAGAEWGEADGEWRSGRCGAGHAGRAGRDGEGQRHSGGEAGWCGWGGGRAGPNGQTWDWAWRFDRKGRAGTAQGQAPPQGW